MNFFGLPPQAVPLLDVDAELAAVIPEPEREQARWSSAVRMLEVAGPRWDPRAIPTGRLDWLGLLVVKGLLVRRVGVASRTACEIFGPGDVFRPWDDDGDPLTIVVEWLVLADTQLAVLDGELSGRLARWPTVSAELVRRVAARARYLTITAAITHHPRAQARLLLMFWLMADRWGVVTVDGMLIRLALTHQVLAALVGCRRPTVTLALKRLADKQLLLRQSSSRWLLTHKAAELLREPESLSCFAMQSTI